MLIKRTADMEPLPQRLRFREFDFSFIAFHCLVSHSWAIGS